MKRFKLTKSSVDTRCLPPTPGETNGAGRPRKQNIYWDTELAGFGIVVGTRAKSYIVQRDLRGRSVRVTIGRHGAWTADMARRRAREIVVDMDRGVDPNAERRRRGARGITLRQAADMNSARLRNRGRQPRTVQTFQEEVARHLGAWLDRPLAEITPDECIRLHARLSAERGRFVANRVLAHVRASYNTARRAHRDLPDNPVGAVTMHASQRRRSPVADLAAWYAEVRALGNPVQRDLQLLLLFTGLRKTDALTARWEHVDLAAGTLHLPCPKGGESRAFTIPLPRRVLELLARRRQENPVLYGEGDGGWVFPTRDRRGRVAHLVSPARGLPSPHRLRDTYITAAHEAGVGPWDIKVLVNHRFASGDVTAGYIRQSLPHLRACAERVAEFLEKRLSSHTSRNTSQIVEIA